MNKNKIIELKTSNKKIINFYEQYPQLDFENVNLMIINLYENMIDSVTGSMNKLVSNQILMDIKHQTQNIELFKSELSKMTTIQSITNQQLNSEIIMVKDMLNKMNNEISNNIITKLFDIKQSYTDDLKFILCNSQNDNITKIIDKIEKENSNIINNTTNIIQQLLPKHYDQIYNNYESIINEFKIDMNTNIENIKLSNNNISLDKINEIIENKYNKLYYYQ